VGRTREGLLKKTKGGNNGEKRGPRSKGDICQNTEGKKERDHRKGGREALRLYC